MPTPNNPDPPDPGQSDTLPTWRQSWKEAPVSMFFSTFGGVGHIPGGPGTYAAAIFTPAIVWMSSWPMLWRVGPFVVVTLLSMYWAEHAGRALGEHDSRRIVMDEVVGVWTTLVWFGSLGWLEALVGLVVFRILDMTKPPPAKRLDDEGEGGVSVIADDLVAGVWAIPAVLLVRWLMG